LGKSKDNSLILIEQIEPRILLIRGQRVIFDADLARLYEVPTKRLNEQVRRNQGRFPVDFAWQLTRLEKDEVVANCGHLSRLKFSHAMPYAFTEYGALMAANVLNTPRAIDVSISVVKAFINLWELLSSQQSLADKLGELERKVSSRDKAIQSLVAAIRRLMQLPPSPPARKIGFHVKEKASNQERDTMKRATRNNLKLRGSPSAEKEIGA
jgi:hypothetical protein